MKLFLVDVVTRSTILEVLVHAEDSAAAHAHVKSKFSGCQLQNARELADKTKHFVLAERDKA